MANLSILEKGKIQKHPSLTAWENGDITPSSGPENLTVPIAGRCNLSCFMCGHSIVEELPIKIDVNKLEPFLKDASNIVITGGEPLWISGDVNRQAGEILESIENEFPNVRVSAFTNGVYLPDHIAEKIIKQFQMISFSIDSLDPSIYEKIRGRHVLPQVLKNLDKLLALKKLEQLGLNDYPIINVNAILSKSTADGLPALADYLSRREVQSLNIVELRNVLSEEYKEQIAEDFPPEIYAERARVETANIVNAIAEEVTSRADLGEEKVSRITDGLIKVFKNSTLNIVDRTGVFGEKESLEKVPDNGNRTCPLPWINAELHSNGNIYFCCANGIILGNVNEQSFDEIWNGGTATSLREAFISGEMAGCIESGCSSRIDYFSNPDAHSKKLLENLKKRFEEINPNSILFLRSAPPYQSRIALKSISLAFPNAAITVVTNPSGEKICQEWKIGKTVVYPANRFEPVPFEKWRKENLPKDFDLVIAPCSNNSPGAYENIERILKDINAKKKLKILPGGELTVYD